MEIQRLDAEAVGKSFLAGAACLADAKQIINELNVFPVPDGDTGTNMTMTMMSAVKEVQALGEGYDMKSLCRAISMGSLRGARGNSGVILSQLLRGFTKVIEEYDELDRKILSAACSKAVETAYKAVMKPKEGTILTVAKGISDKAEELLLSDEALSPADFIKALLSHGEYVLSLTPDMLPVLKEAGVVDSGGRGLVEILRGIYLHISGDSVDLDLEKIENMRPVPGSSLDGSPKISAVASAEIKFGYCTEFIIMLEKPFDEEGFKSFLESIGDSVVCVFMESMVKVHVHTDHPGTAFEEGLKYGQLTSMKVDNLREEHHERLFNLTSDGTYKEIKGIEGTPVSKSEPPKKYGFISVSAGKGLSDIFTNLGVDVVIEGGQTMNPSTDDIYKAIERVNAENIYIFPNNKNILLSASQAASMANSAESIKSSVVVIPTKTIPQGMNALISFIQDYEPKENEEAMKEAMDQVKTGELTYAVRDTEIDGYAIKSGDLMGIGDHSILSVGKDLESAALEMINKMVDDSSEIVSIFYGEDVKEEEANELKEKAEKAYPNLEIDCHYGGQPIYYYLIAVE
ncbi:MAG: DAK2 domain-containing protein [Lachnospiraceae bacterium]|nr:DAK2 domain-containing protein [Lachnospiraceae bacterium]